MEETPVDARDAHVRT